MRHSADVEPVAKSSSRKKSCSEALYKFTRKALLRFCFGKVADIQRFHIK